MKEYVLAIDHGTTSTRAVAVDNAGTMLAVSQKEHQQILPRAGWVEHDPREIWENTRQVLEETLQQLGLAEVSIVAVGVANQRETTVVWDKHTGIPVYNAIVWQDTRTHEFIESLSEEGGIDRFRNDTGLPLAPYFSASKLWWILSHVEGVRERAMAGDLMAGTMDSWLVWNLTGGVQTGQHVTDVTNASRTLLMDLKSLMWREDLAAVFDIPLGLLPRIVASSQVVGPVVGFEGLKGVPVAGILGDQQAACFGQAAVYPGESKNTFGTANGLLVNIGGEPVTSSHGLITTVAYQLEGHAPTYALEGIIAVAGSLIHWLRDNLKIISAFNDVEPLANEVDDNGGVYIVPAFSGLFAPYWRSDARGVIVGLTHFVTQAHIARAALEAIAFQSAEILHAMREDSGVDIHEIRVDGGMVRNELLMQMHANIAGIPVIRPSEIESTALGAAYAAGIAVGFWSGLEDIRENWREDKRWLPDLAPADRDYALSQWAKAVEKSLGWVD